MDEPKKSRWRRLEAIIYVLFGLSYLNVASLVASTKPALRNPFHAQLVILSVVVGIAAIAVGVCVPFSRKIAWLFVLIVIAAFSAFLLLFAIPEWCDWYYGIKPFRK